MWSTCLKVFFQYPIPARQKAVEYWLSGETPEDEDLKTIGVSTDPSDHTVEAREARAGKILQTLGQMLKDDRPIVACFDCLEMVEQPDRLRAFGKMILYLYEYVPCVLPIVTPRVQWWKESG